jgi:DNA-binding beta-propeller fold protein YncE
MKLYKLFFKHFLVSVVLFTSCSNKGKEPEKHIANKEKALVIEDTTKAKNGIFKELVLLRRIHAIDTLIKEEKDVYDSSIYSPKSAIYSKDGSKFYINSLEGYETVVYSSKTLEKLKVIKHSFTEKNQYLFKNNETTVFGYPFKQQQENYNIFKGKPVESTLSHNGKYLWVTYYRRDFDENASSPSAVAIIDTEKDEIVRVLPSGPLPKMIATSPDNHYVAVTHWGDNTVGIVDVSGSDPNSFKYIKHVYVDEKLSMDFEDGKKVNRDNECGNCLRGTVFTPDGSKLLVAKMGGNGIAVIDTKDFSYTGTIVGAKSNLRHMVINNGNLVLSSNKYGAVQKAPLNEILNTPLQNTFYTFTNWETTEVGYGARTIDVTPDGKYIFACVNGACKIAVIETQKMQVIATYDVSKFPVGMALSQNGRQLIVTSQGKENVEKSGNAVSVFEVVYK